MQAADLGRPVSYEFLGPIGSTGMRSPATTRGRSSPWLRAALVLVLTSPRLRRDSALLALVALAAACVLVNELWRFEFPFEYRRVGLSTWPLDSSCSWARRSLASGRTSRGPRSGRLRCLYVAQLLDRSPASATCARWSAAAVARGLGTGGVPQISSTAAGCRTHPCSCRTVACTSPSHTSCVGRRFRRSEERQVGFENRLPLARKASTILRRRARRAGARRDSRRPLRGRRPALHVRPRPPTRRHRGRGQNEELVVVQLPPPS